MATITVRYNDVSKAKAEEIANAIGISLSSAISIFTAPAEESPLFASTDMNALFAEAIKNSAGVPTPPPSVYLDEQGNLKYTDEE